MSIESLLELLFISWFLLIIVILLTYFCREQSDESLAGLPRPVTRFAHLREAPYPVFGIWHGLITSV
jgi:hypothetical protein